jgi:hypothetical protein
MSSLLGWLLLLGGLAAALVGMFALPLGDAMQAVIVFGGLGAVIVGAIALLVVRMSGTEGPPPGSASPLVGIVSPATRPPSVARTLPASRALRQGRARTAGAERVPAASRRLGSAITWAIFGALYHVSGVAGSGSWLEFMAGLLILLMPVGIIAAIASRMLLGRAWGWAVSLAIAGTGFVAGFMVGALIADLLGG